MYFVGIFVLFYLIIIILIKYSFSPIIII